MIRYIPFLKAKIGELAAMGELCPKVKQAICPFFDFPRRKPIYSSEAYATTARRIATSLKNHWGADAEFYFDDLDIGQKLTLKGEHQYAYVLKSLQELQVIPVVALGRTEHNNNVAQLKCDGKITSATVAFRAVESDFEDFDAREDRIDYEFASVFKEFEAIDLVLDCRLCTSKNVSETAQQIAAFAEKFCATTDKVRRVIVAGSSIPGSLRDIVESKATEVLPRRELAIFARARGLTSIELIGGDYATVSPFYSDADIPPNLFPKITSPRLIYSFDHSHYIDRGSSLAKGGWDQYAGMIKRLCGQDFFRKGYSTGDDYFYAKSQRIGKNATNGTVVKPSVVAHITYMALGAKS